MKALAYVFAVVLTVLGATLLLGARERAHVTADGAGNTFSTGINSEALSASPTTDHIAAGSFQKLSLFSFVSSGTTTHVYVDCELSSDGTNWHPVADYDEADAGITTVESKVYEFAATSGANDYVAPIVIDLDAEHVRCTYRGGGTSHITARGHLHD